MTLYGNSEQYTLIKEWIIAQFNRNDVKISLDNFLFVTGDSGIGKSYSIKEICESLNLHVIYLTTNNCSNSSELNDNIIKSTTSSMLQILTNNIKPKIMIIDEFDSMMAIDRTINTTLLNILTEKKIKPIPIICISSIEIVKKIGTIKKKCQIVKLDTPNDTELFDLLTKLFPDKSEQIITNMIKNSNCNLALCVHNLRTNCCHHYDARDKILNIQYLYGNEFNRNNMISILLNDPWLIPLRFHENLINELKIRRSTIKKSHMYYKQFISNFLFFDILMYKNIIDIASHFFTSSIQPLTQMPKKTNKISDISGFTKMLSYLSLQKKYIKKSYSSNFPLYQISNYHTNIIGRNYIFFN